MSGGHIEAVKVLVGKQGQCWVDAHDAEGCTPLHLAARGFAAPAAAGAASGGAGRRKREEEGENMLPGEGKSSTVDPFTAAEQQQNSGMHGLVGGEE